MQKEKQKKFKMLSPLLKNVIEKPICKICFEVFSPRGINSFKENHYLCPKCRKSLTPIYHQYMVNGISYLSIYEYKAPLSNWIYQYKESFDIELAPIFIDGLSLYLSIKYFSYYVIFMPSSSSSIERRGFNNLPLMFNSLNLKVIENELYKLDEIDQKNLSKRERISHVDFIGIRDLNIIRGKNILLIDDVISTGTSILEAIKVLKKGEPKRIKVLVLAENKFND